MNATEIAILGVVLAGAQLAGSAIILIVTLKIDARTARLGSEIKDYVAERYRSIRECDRIHTVLDVQMDSAAQR